MQPLAILTMVYNESGKLPFWLAHYQKQVGLENCFIIDHGTEDGSTDNLFGASKIRLPRSPQDNDLRLQLVTSVSNGLLNYYEKVAYVDADELLVADPKIYENLSQYASRSRHSVVTSIGLEVCHVPDVEASLQTDLPIGVQRSFVMYSSSMCKANLIGRPVVWAPGWHAYDGAPVFDDLYLFHLRHADMEQAISRLEITRAMPWAKERAGLHQRVTNVEMSQLVRQFGGRPQIQPQDLLSADSPLPNDLEMFVKDCIVQEPGRPYNVPLARYGSKLMRLPDRFKAALGAPMLAK